MKLDAKLPAERPERSRLFRVARRLALPAIGLGLLLSGFLAGLMTYAKIPAILEGWGGEMPRGQGLMSTVRSQLTRWRRNVGDVDADTRIDVLSLDIKHTNYQKLADKRAQALRAGVLVTAEDDYVPATIRLGSQQTRVRVRLKGDRVDHFDGDVWSMRVKTRDGGQVLGFRRFSLQHPKTRGYHWDHLYLDELRRHGILAARHHYVELRLNGKNLGVVDMEEHFSKELLESQGRREGVILALDDRLYWEWNRETGNWLDVARLYPRMTTFGSAKLQENPKVSHMDRIGRGLVRGYFEGRLPAHEVFDARLWGRFLAISEIWEQLHSMAYNNVRFYLNPVSGLLEPVVFDSMGFLDRPEEMLWSTGRFLARRLLEDEVIARAFCSELETLRSEVRGKEFVDRIRRADRALRAQLLTQFPLVPARDPDALVARADQLAKVRPDNLLTLDRFAPPFPEPCRALLVETGGQLELQVANQTNGPLQLVAVEVKGAAAPVRHAVAQEVPPAVAGSYVVHRVTLPAGVALGAKDLVTLHGRVPLSDEDFAVPAYREAPCVDAPVLRSQSLAEIQELLPSFRYEAAARQLRVPAGRHRISGRVIMPPGVGLVVDAGAVLEFAGDAALVVRGPCQMGSEGGGEVILERAGEDRWQGIMVHRPGAPCAWHGVRVRGTKGLSIPGLTLTGSSVFYQAEVRLRGCSFVDSQAEDALNLIESRIDLQDVDFAETRSDALDADFCTGVIRGGKLRAVGGDGLDFSGSHIQISGTEFSEVKDKAISVGEATEVEIEGVDIHACGTGIAVKDGSKAKVRRSRLRGIEHVAVMSYAKKPEYGGGRTECTALTIADTPTAHLCQLGSVHVVDGEELPARDVDIDALYKSGYMKK